MSEFDNKARDWDKDKMHVERAEAIAKKLSEMVSLNKTMKALEYGAGTGLLSFELKDKFSEITMMDNSSEMIKVCEEKAAYYGAKHIKPVCIDLEHSDYNQTVDIIYNQMVMHHVTNVNTLLRKFFTLLNPGGYLAIADLYAEDGSFHAPDENVHHGFDPSELGNTLKSIGFKSSKHETCFSVKRPNGRDYPVFLLVAQK